MADRNPHLRVMEDGERRDLIRKSKAGWRKYFLLQDELMDMLDKQYDLVHLNNELIDRLKKGDSEIDISYLKSQFIELYDSVKKDGECPVCFTKITKANIELPSCGHIVCKSCKDEIIKRDNKCPSCRKKYY